MIWGRSFSFFRLLRLATGFFCATVLAAVHAPTTALAGGFDTPNLFSARHIGMGGTAVAYVDDPSAVVLNPAGLANIEGRASVLGDLSLLLGRLTASPDPAAQSAESELAIAPFFLVGGAYRFDLGRDAAIAIGAAIFPTAVAAGRYEYTRSYGPAGMLPTEDETRLRFLEFSPALAIRLPGRVSFGAGYRLTYVDFSRQKGPLVDVGAPTLADFTLDGINFTGFRVGAQWEPVEDRLSFGVQYRHRITTDLSADRGVLFDGASSQVFDLSTDIVLPSRLVVGVRGDFDDAALAMDIEYGFNSQNDSNTLSFQRMPGEGAPTSELVNVAEWSDAITIRLGAEYAAPLGAGGETLALRAGYIFDAQTVNRSYPTAFGTPPVATHTATAGLGYDGGAFEINLAYAFRHGATTIDSIPVDARRCDTCSGPGDHALTIHGFYADMSYDFD